MVIENASPKDLRCVPRIHGDVFSSRTLAYPIYTHDMEVCCLGSGKRTMETSKVHNLGRNGNGKFKIVAVRDFLYRMSCANFKSLEPAVSEPLQDGQTNIQTNRRISCFIVKIYMYIYV